MKELNKTDKTDKTDKTELRQFIDKIVLLGNKNEYTSTIFEQFKNVIPGSTVENVLINKKKSYDYEYVNIFKEYGLSTEDIYNDLDIIWDNVELPKLNLMVCVMGYPLIHSCEEVKAKWKNYIKETVALAKKRAK